MCGISLIINKKNFSDLHAAIRKINDSAQHRGPDNAGYYLNEYFAMGHRRLSIIDHAQRANQPFEKFGMVISLNGEIYNYTEIRSELEKNGYVFVTNSDTEVFIAAYHLWKTRCFNRMNGMWAAIIYDNNENKIILCRDRMGIKPLVYFTNNEVFIAASEPKQIVNNYSNSWKVNDGRVKDFVLFGSLNQRSETFYNEVNEIKPGNYLSYDLSNHTHTIIEWYTLRKYESDIKNYDDVVQKFRSQFLDSIKLITRADTPVATLLSGGLDSSIILSGVKQLGLLNTSVTGTFSSCFHEKEYDESLYIDSVLKEVNIKSTKIFPLDQNGSLTDIVKKLAYYHDQPLKTTSHLSEYFVFRTVHENGYKVVLGGQGADECLGGYKDFPYLYAWELYKEKKFLSLLNFSRNRGKIEDTGTFRMLKNYVDSINILKTKNSTKPPYWLNPDCKEYYCATNPDYYNSFDDAIYKQIHQTSLPYQLHSEDRNAMMFSIESRQPFLDFNLVELCLSIPYYYKMKNGWSKSIIRDAFPELPKDVRYRKNKLGFPFPKDWFTLHNYKEIIDCLRKNASLFIGYISEPFSQKLLNGSQEDFQKINSDLIFKLYSLCVWHEGFSNNTIYDFQEK